MGGSVMADWGTWLGVVAIGVAIGILAGMNKWPTAGSAIVAGCFGFLWAISRAS